jgi:hypothetical protein
MNGSRERVSRQLRIDGRLGSRHALSVARFEPNLRQLSEGIFRPENGESHQFACDRN